MEKKVSIVENLVVTRSERTIKAIYLAIVGMAFKIQTTILREHLYKGDTDRFNELKKQLYAATFSCRLKGGRKHENIVEYTQLICLDFDHIPTPKAVEHCRKIINDISYTRLSFVSPSGLGLKVIVEVDSGIENHKAAYSQVAKYYEGEIGFPADKNTIDVNRMCFIPHDDNAYLNEASEVFKYQKEENKVKNTLVSNGECQSMEIFEYAVAFTKNKKQFVEGERNPFVFLLASNCNKYGLCKDFVTEICIEKFAEAGFEAEEIRKCVTNAYKNENQFNTWKRPNKKNIENHTLLPDSDKQECEYTSTPFFEDFVYTNLPPLIRDTAELFLDKRSKDIYLLTYLSALSGFAYATSGWYLDENIYPNLFSFIISNPASGKSAMRKVKEIFEELEEVHKSSIVRIEAPKNTFKSLVKQLQESEGLKVLFDEEVEVFGRIFKHDKASISYFIKKGYDNQEISASGRERSNDFFVAKPRFSFVTGGNFEQIARLINTPNDGTRSRLNIYCYDELTPTLNPKPSGWKDFMNQHDTYIEQLVKIVKYIEDYPFEFKLTDNQYSQIKDEEEKMIRIYDTKNTMDMNSVIRRAGVTLFRIAMLLSSYRRFEEGNTHFEYVCSDIDFKVALSISKTLVAHSHFAGEVLKQNVAPSLQDNIKIRQEQILNALPKCFSRKEALSAVKTKELKISARTLDNDLDRMKQSGLVTHSHDKYCKQVA